MKYRKIFLGIAIASFLILSTITATTAFAQGVTITNPIAAESFEDFIGLIAKWLFNVALVVAPIMFVIGGFYYITAQGDPAKIKKAGDLITWTAIGLIVIMLTNGIIKLLKDMVV
jgi:hypothetical protein